LAPPTGTSNDGLGLATDGVHWGSRGPQNFGLHYPVRGEPWHLEPVGGRAMRGTAGAFFSLPDPPDHAFSGVIGEPLDATMQHARDVAQAWLDEQFMFPAISGMGVSGDAGAAPTGGTPAANRALGRAMLEPRGWSGHWDALNNLWTRESGWNHLAQNPTSTAFGIPQFLDCLPLDTDILTRDGWKRHDEVK